MIKIKNHTRRAVAYIAGQIIVQSGATSVYDYLEGRHFSMGGHVSRIDVSVYDYELRCYISGSGDGINYSLYHFGNGKHISISFSDTSFTGYDYDSGKHFSGNVNSNAIAIYDHEESRYFNYSV